MIVVWGAEGINGQEIVRQLGVPGEPVRVLVRDTRTSAATSFLLKDQVARHLLESLRMEAAGGPDPLRVELLMQRLLARVATRSTAPRPVALSPKRLNAVVDWLDAHFAHPITVTELASIAECETSWFSRLFRRSIGCPPYQYVLERRITHARHFLRAGFAPAEVADMCGFVDQAHLTRHFRRIVGQTPGVWVRDASQVERETYKTRIMPMGDARCMRAMPGEFPTV